ncbi:MAG: hypothetical protein ACTHJ8_06490 [Mucilaginibacter sp.]
MKAKLRKSHKKLFIITAIIVGIILILSLIINIYWSPILAKKVRSTVLSSSDSLYTITFSDANLHIMKGEIDIDNIIFKLDTTVYNRRKKNRLAPNNLIELHVKRLILSHIHPFKLYFQHKLHIEQIILKQPEIKISYQLNHTKDTTLKDHRTIWQKMSKTLKSIQVGKILLSDVKFRYEDYSGRKLAISELKEMSLNATDLLIDSATQFDRSRTLYCKDIQAELNNYSGQSRNGLYNYKIKSLRLSTQTSQLNIGGLEVQPVKPQVFFNKTYHDRFKIRLDSLQLNHFDYVTYHKYRILNASALILHNGNLIINSNPRQSPPTNRIKSFPHLALQQLTASITIDTIHARHIDVIYTEYNKKSNKTGTISFNNSSGDIFNVTTNKDSLQKNNICTASIGTYFMNTGKLYVLFKFNLTDKNAAFTYKGSVGPMDLKAVNEACMPLALVKLNSGKLKQMDFDIKASAKNAHGRVSVLYNDLKVTILKADTNHDRLKHMTIASLFANTLIIKHNNPDDDGEKPRYADVVYERPDTITFWGSMWQTLFAGIKPCAGVTKQVQENIKVQIAGQKVKKQERIVKRAQRKQRREERRRKRELKKELKKQDEAANGMVTSS